MAAPAKPVECLDGVPAKVGGYIYDLGAPVCSMNISIDRSATSMDEARLRARPETDS